MCAPGIWAGRGFQSFSNYRNLSHECTYCRKRYGLCLHVEVVFCQVYISLEEKINLTPVKEEISCMCPAVGNLKGTVNGFKKHSAGIKSFTLQGYHIKQGANGSCCCKK